MARDTAPSTQLRPRARINLLGRDDVIMLDSGAELSFLPSHYASQLLLSPTTQRFVTFNGSPIQPLGTADIHFTFPDSGLSFQHTFYIGDCIMPALGQDFFAKYKLQLCWEVCALLNANQCLAHFIVPQATPRSFNNNAYGLVKISGDMKFYALTSESYPAWTLAHDVYQKFSIGTNQDPYLMGTQDPRVADCAFAPINTQHHCSSHGANTCSCPSVMDPSILRIVYPGSAVETNHHDSNDKAHATDSNSSCFVQEKQPHLISMAAYSQGTSLVTAIKENTPYFYGDMSTVFEPGLSTNDSSDCNVSSLKIPLNTGMMSDLSLQQQQSVDFVPDECGQDPSLMAFMCALAAEEESQPAEVPRDVAPLPSDFLPVLEEYQDLFTEEFDPQVKHRIVHSIRLTGTPRPVHLYRVPLHYQEPLRKILIRQMDQGIIRPSSAPYASPLTMQPKKSGEFRACIDYRALNEVVLTDAYTMPRIDDLIAKVHGQVFSVIDLKDGFHQIPLDDISVPLTAFATPFGTFEYLRMPFGLKTSPAGFQRFINAVLWGLSGLVAYIDDILIFSDSQQQHLLTLMEIFSRFRYYGIKINKKKSSFFRTQVTFLGFDFDSAGRRPTQSALPKLQGLKPPKTRRQLQSFLEVVGYYINHIPHFAKMAIPLYELVAQNTKFKWTTRQQEALSRLRYVNVYLSHIPDLTCLLTYTATPRAWQWDPC